MRAIKRQCVDENEAQKKLQGNTSLDVDIKHPPKNPRIVKELTNQSLIPLATRNSNRQNTVQQKSLLEPVNLFIELKKTDLLKNYFRSTMYRGSSVAVQLW